MYRQLIALGRKGVCEDGGQLSRAPKVGDLDMGPSTKKEPELRFEALYCSLRLVHGYYCSNLDGHEHFFGHTPRGGHHQRR